MTYIHVGRLYAAIVASLQRSQNCLEQVLNIMHSIMAWKVSHQDVANNFAPDKFVELLSSNQTQNTQIKKPPNGGLFIWRTRKDKSGHGYKI